MAGRSILPSPSLSDLTGTSLVKRRERATFQWVLEPAGLTVVSALSLRLLQDALGINYGLVAQLIVTARGTAWRKPGARIGWTSMPI
jgi:hypothetical protein